MCSWRRDWRSALAAVALVSVAGPIVSAAPATAARDTYPGIGRAATASELQAWDLDVRPDFKGLPPGAGSVAQGQVVWESKCASCHGIFGESGEVFFPIVGGTTGDDLRTGRVARLTDNAYPGRTTLMKLATVSTLWDYIRRAMPWNQPKSLAVDEVYAVSAYILNLGGIVPDDFVLSDRTMAEAQRRLPNRNGMRTDHALWPGRELGSRVPDVGARACMHACVSEPAVVASTLPDYARDAHGNLADQNRLDGPQRGVQTVAPAAAASVPAAAAESAAAPTALLERNS
ncbi:MAG TPA: cytochrome c, partial [Burkholderiaceae bacterium]|nr:cytochrome c [Burkholderiaceae bacterium]